MQESVWSLIVTTNIVATPWRLFHIFARLGEPISVAANKLLEIFQTIAGVAWTTPTKRHTPTLIQGIHLFYGRSLPPTLIGNNNVWDIYSHGADTTVNFQFVIHFSYSYFLWFCHQQ